MDSNNYSYRSLRPGPVAVYGALLNFRGALAALGDAVNAAPYKSPPQAPVLYLKSPNTHRRHGDPIPVPLSESELEMGATLGIVIGQIATRVSVEKALTFVRGYCVVNDVCIPHNSVYRPAIRQRCSDGFCPVSAETPRDSIGSPDALTIRTWVNDQLQAENTTANLLRPVSRLIADVTDFMTLSPGDILLVGTPENAAHARSGDKVRIEIDGVGILENSLVAETDLMRFATGGLQ